MRITKPKTQNQVCQIENQTKLNGSWKIQTDPALQRYEKKLIASSALYAGALDLLKGKELAW